MVKIIAIDGPASVGKSTLAKKLSKKYKSPILYSGKLYRAVALEIIRKDVNPNSINKILECIRHIDLNKLDTTELYSREVDRLSSIISAKQKLRDKLIMLQKASFQLLKAEILERLFFLMQITKYFYGLTPRLGQKEDMIRL